MPAVSKKQRRMAAIALHHPEKLRGKGMAHMKRSQLEELAETREKGLPEKKKKKKKKGGK